MPRPACSLCPMDCGSASIIDQHSAGTSHRGGHFRHRILDNRRGGCSNSRRACRKCPASTGGGEEPRSQSTARWSASRCEAVPRPLLWHQTARGNLTTQWPIAFLRCCLGPKWLPSMRLAICHTAARLRCCHASSISLFAGHSHTRCSLVSSARWHRAHVASTK